MEPIRVMLVDDHVLVREGIKNLLETDGSTKVVEEASDGEECLEKIQFSKPQVLLLDISMPNMNGIKVLEEMKKREFPVKTLILTAHDDVDYLMEAVDVGADGYLLKESEFSELKQAIQTVMDGEQYIQPRLLPILNERLESREEDLDKIKALTKREKEVLSQIATGKLNKEIAASLNISERTVKNHIFSIFRKLDVYDRTQAAIFAIKNNMVKIA